MDKRLFKDLASAVKDALAFERGEQIELRVTAPSKSRRARKAIRLRKKRMERQTSA